MSLSSKPIKQNNSSILIGNCFYNFSFRVGIWRILINFKQFERKRGKVSKKVAIIGAESLVYLAHISLKTRPFY